MWVDAGSIGWPSQLGISSPNAAGTRPRSIRPSTATRRLTTPILSAGEPVELAAWIPDGGSSLAASRTDGVIAAFMAGRSTEPGERRILGYDGGASGSTREGALDRHVEANAGRLAEQRRDRVGP